MEGHAAGWGPPRVPLRFCQDERFDVLAADVAGHVGVLVSMKYGFLYKIGMMMVREAV